MGIMFYWKAPNWLILVEFWGLSRVSSGFVRDPVTVAGDCSSWACATGFGILGRGRSVLILFTTMKIRDGWHLAFVVCYRGRRNDGQFGLLPFARIVLRFARAVRRLRGTRNQGRRRDRVTVDATGVARGAVSTFFVRAHASSAAKTPALEALAEVDPGYSV
jgi:hypothetical protein